MASTVVAAAARSDVPPRQPVVDPSPSSSPDNAANRSDSFSSSPNHFSDAEIQLQTPDVLKSEEYRQLFRLPQEEPLCICKGKAAYNIPPPYLRIAKSLWAMGYEVFIVPWSSNSRVLIEDFNCALQENLLIQGHMYLFVNFICFYSNIFGYETKKIIPFPEVTSVRRAKTAGLFPNAIEILAGNKKYFFASFLSRDEAFRIINEGWSRQGNGAIAIMEQKPCPCICKEAVSGFEPMTVTKAQLCLHESMSESSSQENGFVAVENVKSSDITDNGSLSTDLSKDTTLTSIVGDDPVSTADSEKQCNVKQVAEPELNNDAPSAASVSWKWNEEDIDAPSNNLMDLNLFSKNAVLEAYTCVADSVFPMKVEDFFRYLFSDDALNFLESFRQKCGDKDFRCSPWHPQEKFGYARELSFQHPIKIYLGAKFGGCHEVQKFRVYRNSHLVIETSQEVSDVPYADYFRVEGLWSVERDKDESKECCTLRVYVNVAFSKKTIWKGKIIQSTIEECRDAYATWINMAHEMLKQKNLEKQAQNGEINLDREVKTRESSEGSPEQSNPTKILATSNAFDAATHNVGSHLQGNFIEPSSVSLFKEFMTKFRSSLRSHSNLSLLLITIVALIFFIQQFSILVLLARPQHIHMNTPVDIMNRMNNEVTRSPSDIAWLEKRIHHLKDEMYMVESRLERMRIMAYLKCGRRRNNHRNNHHP
ncbi:Protein VASCULAR ASSOCIATED DEATH 1, chloroplastic isoform B [Glycine soja]|uniref:Protein VASCULAR ASSOCIATED DEATH 1, chloroplastic isoform B n=1 Tax=Glycine soja TaxID=3848 RepID=A0A445ILC5_GLYSO|nr:Protein VASCULAR ASSOCIATED DEATH 1, chloroplastic isoform B [Glycine soja]